MTHSIAHIVVGLAVDGPFDYSIPEKFQSTLKKGQRVWVNFANRKRVGYVIGLSNTSEFDQLNPILSIIDSESLVSESQMVLAQTIANHYGCSLGEAIDIQFPRLIRQGRAVAIEGSIKQNKRKATKTFMDMSRWPDIHARIKQTLDAGEQVLILVPEDCLYDYVKEQLKNIIDTKRCLFQKKCTPKDDLLRWKNLQAGDMDVLIGVRSSVFAPLPNLGLVLMLEDFHDGYKEEQSPFFHARDVLEWRQATQGFDVIFISQAPSLSLYHQKTQKLSSNLSSIVLDLNNYKQVERYLFSPPARQHIEAQLNEGLPVMAFVFSLALIDRVKEWLAKFFPQAKVAVYDKASKKLPKRFDILIATQAIFRYRYTWQIPSAIVIDVDAALQRMDYKSSERMFMYLQCLHSMTQDRFIMQSEHVDQPCLKALVQNKPELFYEEELKLRQDLGYPPAQYVIHVVTRNADMDTAETVSKELHQIMLANLPDGVSCLPPHPDIVPLLRNKHRFVIIVRSKDITSTVDFIKTSIKNTRKKKKSVITINVNP